MGPLPAGCRFAEILHRDNVQTSPPHLSAVVEQFEAHCVRNAMCVQPASIPHPNVSDPLYVSSHISLRGRALRNRESASFDKVYAL